ncbi:MAG: GntR family transcriptional regulator [Novosphingobium sp.]|nr:GntR family transcriptional regulator [Novosphingobium sp.]
MAVQNPTRQKRALVPATADRLRDKVFARAPQERIGSLPDLAKGFGVGIVTVQQAARILEHEGLLEVRRGPGGGYYGARPDAAALERAIGVFMRLHPSSFEEALDITSLLFTELAAAAARCADDSLREELRALAGRIDDSETQPQRGAFEAEFQDLLFRMVKRPLFEVLTRVTLGFAVSQASQLLDPTAFGTVHWSAGRHRIVTAILRQDPELARFEADRSNRRAVMSGTLREQGVASSRS